MAQTCDICEVELVEVNEELKNGKCLKFKNGDEDIYVTRCDSCYAKDKSLKYQKCEVYSRVCGYIRPVHQWNKAKVEEYNNRINFKNTMTEETPVVPEATEEVVAPVEEAVEATPEVVA